MNKEEPKMPYNDKLLKERAVLLGMPISDEEATQVIAKLLFLQMQSTNSPITMYINSPGGSATAGLAIIETIESLKPEVRTCCIGQAQSMAAIILATGSHGKRSALTNSIISFSEITASGDMTPEKQAHLDRLTAVLLGKTSKATGMTIEEVKKLFASGRLLPPQEARNLGIVDQVTERCAPVGF